LNAISGYSTAMQRYYYIASGASAGDKLGKILMDAFALTLERFISPIKVHFVGYDPDQPTDYSAATDLTNNKTSRAGIHCLTFELKTETSSRLALISGEK
jgi:hypothetical protein